MRKILYFICVLSLFVIKGIAQGNPQKQLAESDSLALLNDLMKLLDGGSTPESFVFANLGIGNRLFSIKNNALNAFQGSANVTIVSPSVGYFHKSGFGLTAGANLLNDGGGFGINQYSLSPSFDYTRNKNISFNISYAHYFVKDKYSSFSSPVQNDFYAAFAYKKTWIQPGIALGYAAGNYREANYKDTVIAGFRRHFYDSVNNKLNVFSFMLTASHQFSWFNIFSKSDGVTLTPTLMANAGSGKTTISHNTNAILLFDLLIRRGRIPTLQKSKFQIQSIGLNMDISYMIGNFSFQPQLYLDHYLQATDTNTKKTTSIFTFNIGYFF